MSRALYGAAVESTVSCGLGEPPTTPWKARLFFITIRFFLLTKLLKLIRRPHFEPRICWRTAKARDEPIRAGNCARNHEWRASFLSTGEIGLASKVAEDGRRSTAGQEVRVIDVPADAGRGMGLFEELHGFNRPGDLAEALRDATQRHYGHAARAFIAEIVKDVPGIASEVRDAIATIVSKICPNGADGQVRRVARRFALTACAGEFAISFGIVPWTHGAAFEASQRLFDDWLRSRGGSGQKETNDALDVVFGFLTRHAARFRPWEIPTRRFTIALALFATLKRGEPSISSPQRFKMRCAGKVASIPNTRREYWRNRDTC